LEGPAHKTFVIWLLGALSVVTPFAIDMYLPSFPEVAHDFGVIQATIALTVSSYFVGMALGQVFYGPLLDRFGRKTPLLTGLCVFIAAAVACVYAPSAPVFIALRFVQGMGGCAAGVASMAIIQDSFPLEERPKVLSRLFLFIAASPLLAPSFGGLIKEYFGWKTVFWLLAGVAAAITALIQTCLPESHKPDAGISLKPLPIALEYLRIARHPRFAVYGFSSAFAFAGLFAYVAGSPVVFLEGFHLSTKAYSAVFALLASGFILGSQVNPLLLRSWTSEQIFFRVLVAQGAVGAVFLLGAWAEWWGLAATLALFFAYLFAAGLTYPNGAVLAIAPFTRNAGSASAMLGFVQLGTGALVSTGVGAIAGHAALPIIALLAATSAAGLAVLLAGHKKALASPLTEDIPATMTPEEKEAMAPEARAP
jgi:DHA1 family bicyclomycin/chloramphenicol resistance-like MFS transporter